MKYNDFWVKDRKVPYTVIEKLSDFPEEDESGIIYLTDPVYYIEGNIDLGSLRLWANNPIVIKSSSSEVCTITRSVNDGLSLLTARNTIIIKDITFTTPLALDLDGVVNALSAIDWYGVNFSNCATIGTIKNYSNTIFISMAFLNSGNLTFDGTIGTIGFDTCLFSNPTGTMIIVPGTAIITRRFRIIYSSFVVTSPNIGINVSDSATIAIESYILDTVNFSGGGTYLSGVSYTSNKSLFDNNKGIINSANISEYYMQGNATPTVIGAPDTFYKVAGTTTSGVVLQKFINTDNRATFTGAIPRFFKVSAAISASAGNNQELTFAVFVNGTVQNDSISTTTTSGLGKSENGKTQSVVLLNQNDYVEIWCSNGSLSDVLVEQLSVIIEALN